MGKAFVVAILNLRVLDELFKLAIKNVEAATCLRCVTRENTHADILPVDGRERPTNVLVEDLRDREDLGPLLVEDPPTDCHSAEEHRKAKPEAEEERPHVAEE